MQKYHFLCFIGLCDAVPRSTDLQLAYVQINFSRIHAGWLLLHQHYGDRFITGRHLAQASLPNQMATYH